jgi:hypothetical protein
MTLLFADTSEQIIQRPESVKSAGFFADAFSS